MTSRISARSSYFVSSGDEGRVRRPQDVVNAVIGVLLLVWAVVERDALPQWARSLTEFVSSGPHWIHILLAIGYLLSLLYALVVTVALIAGRSKHPGAVRDLFIVAIGASALVAILSLLVNDAWPYVYPEVGLEDPVPRLPVSRVAVVTAILLVVSPYVTRPLRWFGWLAIVTTAVAAVGLSYGSPLDTIGSFGLGLFSAGLVLAVVGTPRGYPSPEAVADALRVLGTPTRNLRPSGRQQWGLVRFEAEDEFGQGLEIRVHGRDSVDSQFWAKLWRTLTYKEMGRTFSYSRLQAVEHEALVTFVAARAGVRVPAMVAVGASSGEIALIAVRAHPVGLDTLEPNAVTQGQLEDTWRQVGALHHANLSHGNLTTSAVRIEGEESLLADFGLSSLAPGVDAVAGDIVELLFSMAKLVGPDRAVRAAAEGIGHDALVAALPYVQVPAVSSASRQGVHKPKNMIGSLQEAIVSVTGAEMPEQVELRRVTGKSLLGAAIALLLVTALVPLFTEVDYAAIWDVIHDADWTLIVIALIVGHLQYVPQSTSTMFAVPLPLPFWPLMVLQTASQFLSLAIPSAAGRIAMNMAFLRKQGVSVTVAVSQGAVDGASAFLIQLVILLVVWLASGVNLGFDVDPEDVPWLAILGVLAALIVIVVVVVIRVPKVHARVVPVARDAWGELKVVFTQPARAIGLFASNFVYWNILGLTLWLILQAVGSDLGYGPALFVAAGASLFAGIMPVPGGVGVAEAATTALLAAFGVDQSIAFAATAVYRIITFYLPALEGLFGTRWLQANDYI